jgi:quinol monooxygenase YgiN
MLVIAGTIRLDPDRVETARTAAIEMMAETRKEPGNVAYVFSSSFEDPGVVHLFEHWESQDALDAHVKAPHMTVFRQVMATLGIAEMNVQKYEVSSVGPLSTG